jgi:YD repeat-containing protein
VITRVEGGLTYTQTFDAENRLVSVTVNGQTTQFVYDGDGNPSASSGQARVESIASPLGTKVPRTLAERD